MPDKERQPLTAAHSDSELEEPRDLSTERLAEIARQCLLRWDAYPSIPGGLRWKRNGITAVFALAGRVRVAEERAVSAEAALAAVVAWVRHGEGNEADVAEMADAALAGSSPAAEAETCEHLDPIGDRCVDCGADLAASGVSDTREGDRPTCEVCGTTEDLRCVPIMTGDKWGEPAKHPVCGACFCAWYEGGCTTPEAILAYRARTASPVPAVADDPESETL